MPARIDQFINSQLGLSLVVSLASALPPALGYRLAYLAGRWFASKRDLEIVRAVRSNQWVVSEGQANEKELDQAVRAVFQSTARSIYELYHYLRRPAEIEKLFVLEPSFQHWVERPEFDRRGLVVAGLHISSFDLAVQWICMSGAKPLVLTIADPQGGRRMEFEMRKNLGMNLVPGTVSGLRQALRHLQQGGVVATGIDRPVPESDLRPRFFGRPSSLPTHHIYLAVKTNTPIILVAVRHAEDGKYHISASHEIEMESCPDREDELLLNAERVLTVAESFIRETPQQWAMSFAVWPEARV